MIGIGGVWGDIKNNPRIRDVKFTSEFLDDVSSTLEKRGFHETKLFLWDNTHKEDLRYQSEALIFLIGKMERLERIKRDRSIATYLLREMAIMKAIEE